MVATSDTFDGGRPRSRRIYVNGKLHPDLRVPMREIEQSPTRTLAGVDEQNEPLSVYDCSGPWGDPEMDCQVEEGLPPMRDAWVKGRGDVEEYAGREIRPEDDGYLSERHVESTNGRNQHRVFPGLKRSPLRGKDHPVTQLWYARQ